MNSFHKTAHKLLNEYKKLLRKQLAPAQMQERLQELGLDKRLPKNDCELYALWAQVIQEAEARYNSTQPSVRYSGNEHFLAHIKHVFSCYHLEGNEVLHVTQTAARAVIDAIQLVSLPQASLNAERLVELQICADLICKYGSIEQKTLFSNVLKTHLSSNTKAFLPLLNRFQNHILQEPLAEEWSEREAVA